MRWEGPQGSGPARPWCQLVGLQHKPPLLPGETLAWGWGKVGRRTWGSWGGRTRPHAPFFSLKSLSCQFLEKVLLKRMKGGWSNKVTCLTTQRPRSLLFNLGTKCVGPRAGGHPRLPWDSSGQGQPIGLTPPVPWRVEARSPGLLGRRRAGAGRTEGGGQLNSSVALGKSSSLDLWTPFPASAGLTAHVGISARNLH